MKTSLKAILVAMTLLASLASSNAFSWAHVDSKDATVTSVYVSDGGGLLFRLADHYFSKNEWVVIILNGSVLLRRTTNL